MKLARYGNPGQEKPGILDAAGQLRDLSAIVADITAEVLTCDGLRRLAAIDPATLPPVTGTPRYGAPMAQVGKMLCVGLNYAEHAAETNTPLPEQPVLFMKATSAIVGANDDLMIPRGSVKTDWEVELAVVIGARARYLDSPEAALDVVGGFAISNDVSEREYQLERSGQWDLGKSCESFNPLGPYLVTPDEVGDFQKLGLRLKVNGEQRQDGSSANMIFSVAEIIHYLSQHMVLEPGDVINTGTPAGVALGMEGTPYLRAGDVVEVEIDGLGSQRSCLVDA